MFLGLQAGEIWKNKLSATVGNKRTDPNRHFPFYKTRKIAILPIDQNSQGIIPNPSLILMFSKVFSVSVNGLS